MSDNTIVLFRGKPLPVVPPPSDLENLLQASIEILELEDYVEDLKQTVFGLCYAIESALPDIPQAKREQLARTVENARKRIVEAE